MDTLVGTVLLCGFCYLYFPSPVDNGIKTTMITPQEVAQKVTCKSKLYRLYKSYNLEEPTKKTIKMLCYN